MSSKYMSTSQEYPIHFHGWLRIHKTGHCERFTGNNIIPAGTDPLTRVRSKDVIISLNSKVLVRIYIPKSTTSAHNKLPTLIYYHGGGFLIESAASSTYHPTLNLITAESNVVVVSVSYRLAPEYLLPTAYEDSWEAIKWVANHLSGNGPESWLKDHADLQNVFIGGDSAGANIAHNMAIRVGMCNDNERFNKDNIINVMGVILLHPYFGGKDPIGLEAGKHEDYKAFVDQVWKVANRYGVGLDDPLYNPGMDPRISGLDCSRVLVCVGEKDKLRARGLNYKKLMDKSGWKGRVEMMESKGEGHAFFLYDTSSKNASTLRSRICTFINPISSKI